jgi:hypothetical protein
MAPREILDDLREPAAQPRINYRRRAQIYLFFIILPSTCLLLYLEESTQTILTQVGMLVAISLTMGMVSIAIYEVVRALWPKPIKRRDPFWFDLLENTFTWWIFLLAGFTFLYFSQN